MTRERRLKVVCGVIERATPFLASTISSLPWTSPAALRRSSMFRITQFASPLMVGTVMAVQTEDRGVVTHGGALDWAIFSTRLDVLPLRSGSVDSVLCVDLGRAPTVTQGAVRELFRIVRPGGFLILVSCSSSEGVGREITRRSSIDQGVSVVDHRQLRGRRAERTGQRLAERYGSDVQPLGGVSGVLVALRQIAAVLSDRVRPSSASAELFVLQVEGA